jgi:hypothetical protein
MTTANEANDSERAVRAALATQRALTELNQINVGRPALAAGIAIDSGRVVMDATGPIFGEVSNIVAQAQALAGPGAVVVTARVQRQADLQEQRTLECLLEADELKQVLHAHKVGQAEFLVAADCPVDVTLGSKVEYEVTFRKIFKGLNLLLYESVVRMLFENFLFLEIGGITDHINVDDEKTLI